MDYLEIELLAFIKRFPFSTPEFLQDRMVDKHKIMTKGEFAKALYQLESKREIYEPRPGRIEATYGRTRVFTSEGELKLKGKQVKLKMTKPKDYKSKVKIIKRKWVEGYQCESCGKWSARDWSKRGLQKCPKCGARSYKVVSKSGKTYYRKPVLKPAYKKYQRATKHLKALIQYVDPSRVGAPGISVARWGLPPPKPEALLEKQERRKHRKRVDYRGSSDASKAGKQSWETRRKSGWKPKEKPKTLTIKGGHVKLSKSQIAGFRAHASRKGRVLVGFFKDKKGEVRPITKSLGEINRGKIVKKPKRFQSVKPKGKKPWSLPRKVFRPKNAPIVFVDERKKGKKKVRVKR